ncbi:hypothetical protein KEM52_003715 [Ascosphaera acerosa]|nr:hypothetical protein KEM52_003715 [Ascosphaera acerosa]
MKTPQSGRDSRGGCLLYADIKKAHDMVKSEAVLEEVDEIEVKELKYGRDALGFFYRLGKEAPLYAEDWFEQWVARQTKEKTEVAAITGHKVAAIGPSTGESMRALSNTVKMGECVTKSNWIDDDMEVVVHCTCVEVDNDLLQKIAAVKNDDDEKLKRITEEVVKQKYVEFLCEHHLLLLVRKLKLYATCSFAELAHRLRSIGETKMNLGAFRNSTRRQGRGWFLGPAENNESKPSMSKLDKINRFVDAKSHRPSLRGVTPWTTTELKQLYHDISEGSTSIKVDALNDIFRCRHLFSWWDSSCLNSKFGRLTLLEGAQLDAAIFREHLKRRRDELQVPKGELKRIRCYYGIFQQLARADPLLYWSTVALCPQTTWVV